MAITPPEVAFQRAANTAADAVASAPAYISYKVETVATAPSLNQVRTVNRAVDTRTRDDVAVVQDLPQGRRVVTRSFPITPTFDALSYFRFQWRVTAHGTLDASVSDVQPLHYDDVTKTSKADVVVTSLRYYKAAYAQDSSDAPDGTTHVTLEPFAFVKDGQNIKDTLYLTDLYVTNATGLPSEVRLGGDGGLILDVKYRMADSHWVVDSVHYEETISAALGLYHFHVNADSHYRDYLFPATAPDPELAQN